jgi:hypothetical protein
MTESYWSSLRWFVVLNGIADAWLWSFDADGWRLRYDNPANGTLGILSPEDDPAKIATLDDAIWLADVIAYDHDAPVGVQPALEGEWPDLRPIDPAGLPAIRPIQGFAKVDDYLYWQSISGAYGSAAERRFGESYVLRYDREDVPSPPTDFAARFAGREELIALYAMGSRQPDMLLEYLCLYRVIEAADGSNGTGFTAANLEVLQHHDFGALDVVDPNPISSDSVNAFEVYRDRALSELSALDGVGVNDVPRYLYDIRNSLAHGKTNTLHLGSGSRFGAAVRALPIVKLLARIAVEPAPIFLPPQVNDPE